MGKNLDKLNGLTNEQLKAQIKLCFKFMAQCKSILDGEEVRDGEAIRLVDPFGDCDDMELFWACKGVAEDPSLADALETISKQEKVIAKLRKRLAKKSAAASSDGKERDEKKIDFDKVAEYFRQGDISALMKFLRKRSCISSGVSVTLHTAVKEPGRKSKPKYKVGDKLYFIFQNVVRSGVVKQEAARTYDGFSYHLDGRGNVESFQIHEECLFPSVEALFNHLKEGVNGDKD